MPCRRIWWFSAAIYGIQSISHTQYRCVTIFSPNSNFRFVDDLHFFFLIKSNRSRQSTFGFFPSTRYADSSATEEKWKYCIIEWGNWGAERAIGHSWRRITRERAKRTVKWMENHSLVNPRVYRIEFLHNVWESRRIMKRRVQTNSTVVG